MSPEIDKELENFTLTRFWGGDNRGACIQITGKDGHVQLTMEDSAFLAKHLVDFIKDECRRRQDLLKDRIRSLKIDEKTVFNEISELSLDYLGAGKFVVDAVSQYCPKAKERTGK